MASAPPVQVHAGVRVGLGVRVGAKAMWFNVAASAVPAAAIKATWPMRIGSIVMLAPR